MVGGVRDGIAAGMFADEYDSRGLSQVLSSYRRRWGDQDKDAQRSLQQWGYRSERTGQWSFPRALRAGHLAEVNIRVERRWLSVTVAVEIMGMKTWDLGYQAAERLREKVLALSDQ